MDLVYHNFSSDNCRHNGSTGMGVKIERDEWSVVDLTN
jgi:hypothetical protein